MSSELKDLLALLAEHKDTPGDEIELFIQDMAIVPSSKSTRNFIIFWVYLKWVSIDERKSPIPRNVFFKQFKKYFKPASRDTARRYYALSPHFKLSKEELAIAKKECQYERYLHLKRRQGTATAKYLNEHLKEKILENVKVARAALEALKKGTRSQD